MNNISEVLPQNKAIRQYLEKGGRVSILMSSIMFGVAHLPRRIKDLKDIYHLPIDADWVNVRKSNGKMARIKEYYLNTSSHE